MGIVELTDALKNGGPWALLAVSLWVNRYLYLDARKRDDAHKAEVQRLNDRMLETTHAQVALLKQNNDTAKTLMKALAGTTT